MTVADEGPGGNSGNGTASVTTKTPPKIDNERRQKIITSLVIYYCNFSSGVAFNCIGPAIIDYSNKFDTDVAHVSWCFTIATICYLAGAFTGGFVYSYLSREITITVFLSILTAGLFILPYIETITWFFVVCGFLGFAVGGFECGEIVWIIEIWRGEAAVWILAQNFTYSLGTIIPPVLLAPFLRGEEKTDSTTTELTSTSSSPPSSSIPPERFSSDLGVPYTIAGFFVALGVSMLILLTIRNRSLDKKKREQDDTDPVPDPAKAGSTTAIINSDPGISEREPVETPNPNLNMNLRLKRKIILIFTSCCAIAFYQGMEMTTMQFLSTFSVFSENKLSEAEGANVLTGLTIAFAVARFLGIFIAFRVPPHLILVGNFVLILAGNLILLLIGQSNLTWLWVGSILLGLGFSTVYPGFYAYIEQYLYITDGITAVFMVCGGTVSSIYPLIVGKNVEKNPSVLTYVNFFSVALFIVSFSIVFWFTRLRMRKSQRSAS